MKASVTLSFLTLLATPAMLFFPGTGSAQPPFSISLKEAPEYTFPNAVGDWWNWGAADCNSPAHWVGDKFYVYNSPGDGNSYLQSGPDVLHLTPVGAAKFDNTVTGKRWIEATWRAPDGTLYAWYHNEPFEECGDKLTIPRIGAARSTDNGFNYKDLGFVLEAPKGVFTCNALNGYFAGGVGDPSVMVDPQMQFVYFFFGTYAGTAAEQGVMVGRMAFADLDAPAGKVKKWFNGGWTEPGIGGKAKPIFPAAVSWYAANTDAYWGPAIHWNTYLNTYVILLNRTKDKGGFSQEGIYISHNSDLANPAGWSAPEKIVEGGSWYPELFGTQPGETDKLMGKTGRFFMHGVSNHEIEFTKNASAMNATPSGNKGGFQARRTAAGLDFRMQAAKPFTLEIFDGAGGLRVKRTSAGGPLRIRKTDMLPRFGWARCVSGNLNQSWGLVGGDLFPTR